ncbi:MAG TPA: LacI family DNA-binding transcriptional regulator [Chloroflexota bacterium]|nr:LacI family DNA-binding transcriptional regulator [Chloroflexota bacterium]
MACAIGAGVAGRHWSGDERARRDPATVAGEQAEVEPVVTVTRKPSMREVAKTAGVAMSTVSRVISGHPDVSPEMRDRVQQVVERLGYEPHFLAQSLRRGATFSVGFTLSDIANPVIAQYARGAEIALRQAGYSLLVMNAENDPALDYAHVRFLLSRRVDGLLLLMASERKRATLEALARIQVPMVVIDRDFPRRLRASAVLCDHRSGMAAAVDHLIDLGHQHIALISWPLDLRPGRERLAGLRQAFAARGLPDTSIPVLGPFTAEDGERATYELLDNDPAPTAIIAGTNQLLIGCLRALTRRGLRPGADLSLVTSDDIPLAELFTPPIATISRDNIAIGSTAAELLLHRLHGRADPETVILPTTFVPRASCSPPRQ